MGLSCESIAASEGDFVRDTWFLPAETDRPHRLCLFLDAEHYLRDMQAEPMLIEWQSNGTLPPLSCLFVSHVSGAARHQDFPCNPRYADFIARDTVAWVRRRVNLAEAGHMICGLSLSGLAAAFIAFRHSELFSFALCQSGSFWWLADHDVPLPRTDARFWLSVGDQETSTELTHPPSGMYQRISQIEGVEAAALRFRQLGGCIRYHRYSGGHAITPWKEELGPALTWLLSGSDELGTPVEV